MIRFRSVGTLLFMAVCAITVILFAKRGNPTLLGRDNVRDHHGVQLLNPFRDKGAETAAVRFLGSLKDGDCRSSLESIGSNASRVEEICEKERERPLKNWNLEARGEDGDRVLLRFRATRGRGLATIKDPMWIWVTRDGERGWRATGFEPWY